MDSLEPWVKSLLFTRKCSVKAIIAPKLLYNKKFKTEKNVESYLTTQSCIKSEML